jgi:hypothetical protein
VSSLGSAPKSAARQRLPVVIARMARKLPACASAIINSTRMMRGRGITGRWRYSGVRSSAVCTRKRFCPYRHKRRSIVQRGLRRCH